MLLKRAVLLALLGVGCDTCTSDHSEGGATPFSRCLEAEPLQVQERVGSITVGAKSRTLTLGGLPTEPRIAAFQGPGMATTTDSDPVLRQLTAEKADLLLVLGGLGLDTGAAKQHLARIASVGPPVLFLAGGRDSAEAIREARQGLSAQQQANFIDLTPFRHIRAPGYRLTLVAGSENGRMAIHDSACGFVPEDLERIEDGSEHAAGIHRVLVSWEIPARSPVAFSPAGDVGAAALGELRDAFAPQVGLHAWPDLHVMRPQSAERKAVSWGSVTADLHLVVPRLYGPTHERGDGTRQLPGYVVLRLGKAGIYAERPR